MTLRQSHWRGICAALLVWTGALATLRAHPTATGQVVRLFVLPEGAQTTVLLRIPTALVSEARLPAGNDGQLQVANAEPILRAVAADAAANLELQLGGVALPAPAMRAVLSPPSDRSFESAASARDHVRRGTPPDLAVPADQAFVDVELIYAVPPGLKVEPTYSGTAGDWSGRLNAFRSTTEMVRTIAVFESGADDPGSAVTSRFDLAGGPVRVSFNPGLAQTIRDFARRSFGILAARADWLLFLVCLIAGAGASARGRSPLLSAIPALLAGQFIGIWGVRAQAGMAPEGAATALLLAASALAVVALQTIAGALRWQTVLSALVGVLTGVGLAIEYGTIAQFAGAHGTVGQLVFYVAIVAVQLWAAFVLVSVMTLAQRIVTARVVAMLASIVVLHQAVHAMADRADALAQLVSLSGEQILLNLTVLWALIVVSAGIVDGISGRRRARSHVEARGSHPA